MIRVRSLAILVPVLTAALCFAACGQSGSTTSEPTTDSTVASTTESTGASTTQPAGDTTTTTTTGGKVFTLDALAQFDGKDGRSAYVAVDGVVYDVTGSRMWPDGTHARCDFGAAAGRDLSEVITKAPPNMRAVLETMPVVGELAQ
jgi:predicted heme/steroid binding protein